MRTIREHADAISRRNAARAVNALLTYTSDPTEHWRDDALCAQMPDPDEWFPEVGERSLTAKKVCGLCPDWVRDACLAYALDNEITDGVWGGKTRRERQRMRGVA